VLRRCSPMPEFEQFYKKDGNGRIQYLRYLRKSFEPWTTLLTHRGIGRPDRGKLSGWCGNCLLLIGRLAHSRQAIRVLGGLK